MKTILFFNNKGGVGKTTLVYHVAWMLAELGHRCLAVDLDPQTNLTSIFLSDEELERIYIENTAERPTILAGLKMLKRGIGDIQPVKIHTISDRIGLIAGDLELSLLEDKLSDNWGKCLSEDEAAFRITTAFYRIIQEAGNRHESDFCLIDVGPNFGAINRATLIAADFLVVPMAADMFSLQGLTNIGARIGVWKKEWVMRKSLNPDPELNLPNGEIEPLGYVLLQQGMKERRPVLAYRRWANRIPAVFSENVLGLAATENPVSIEADPNALALLKHYHSLMPMSMEARKPIFLLKVADGAIGAHLEAVKNAYKDFKMLTEKIVGMAAFRSAGRPA